MKKLSFKPGFTLIELMVVMAIIGVLATMVGINISGSQKRSKNAKMIAEIKQVQTGFELYYADKGVYDQSANCNAMKTVVYFPQGTPTDNVTYNCTPVAGVREYCVCGAIQEVGGEMKGANSDNNCNFSAATKTHFCVVNAQ
jgi:prepilin-type N-terminal cleavage/methylation domain-containing protein